MSKDERKGFFTPAQEQQLDDLIKAGILEPVDGIAIRMADDKGLQILKEKLAAKYPEAIPIMYQVIDILFQFIPKK